MKKFPIVIAGVVLGAAILVVGAATLLWLFCDNSVSINVRNSSGISLQHVAVVVPGSAFSGYPSDMESGTEFVFGTDDTMKPRRKPLQLRVVFDAGGHHYEVPAALRLAPFGSYLVDISIDQQLQVSVKARFL